MDAAIAAQTAAIAALGAKLDKLDVDLESARARQDDKEVDALRKEKEQLRKEKEQLRSEKEQLRTEKLLQLRHQTGAPSCASCRRRWLPQSCACSPRAPLTPPLQASMTSTPCWSASEHWS